MRKEIDIMLNNNEFEDVHEQFQDDFNQGFSDEDDDIIFEDLPDEDYDIVFEELSDEDIESNIKSEDATNDLHADKDGYSKELDGVQTIEEDGMIHYKGGLGDFRYNPDEFQIEQVMVEPDGYGNAGGPMPILKYIGKETDGNKIKIPDGISSLTLTFADTNITSAPKIPSSVESTSYMFSNCGQLKDANIKIPSKVRSTAAMFAGCNLLEHGPREIPGTVEDMSAMYVGCENLQNMPKLGKGIKCMDSSFANCVSLTQKPKIPSSVVVSDYVTSGCVGIHETEVDRLSKKQNKETKRLEKKLESTKNGSFFGHVGNTLGTILQVGVMTYAGHDVIEAAMVVHALHKAGQLEKGMTGVWGAIVQTTDNAHPFIRSLYNSSVTEHRKANELASMDIKAIKESYMANLSASGNDLNSRMFKAGAKAAKNNRFVEVTSSGNVYAGTEVFRSSFSNGFDKLEQNIEKMQRSGKLDREHKSDVANSILEIVSAQASYYKGGKSAAMGSKGLQTQNDAGIEAVNNTMMNSAMDKIINLQSKYNILSEHHIKEIQSAMASTSYANDKSFKTNFEKLNEISNSRSKSHIDNFMNYSRANRDFRANHNDIYNPEKTDTTFKDDIDMNVNAKKAGSLFNMGTNKVIDGVINAGRGALSVTKIITSPLTDRVQKSVYDFIHKKTGVAPDIQNNNSGTINKDTFTDMAPPHITHNHFMNMHYNAGAKLSSCSEFLNLTDKNEADNIRYSRIGSTTDMIQETINNLANGANKEAVAKNMMNELNKHLAFHAGANSVHYVDVNLEATHRQNLMMVEKSDFQSLSQGFVKLQEEYKIFNKEQLESIAEKLRTTAYSSTPSFNKDANSFMRYASEFESSVNIRKPEPVVTNRQPENSINKNDTISYPDSNYDVSEHSNKPQRSIHSEQSRVNNSNNNRRLPNVHINTESADREYGD